MTGKFTKGEWVASCVTVEGKEVRNGWGVNVDGFTLAAVYTGPTFGVIHGQQKANAHLIAAAPEMYEMLKECQSEIGFLINEVNQHRTTLHSRYDETPPDMYDQESLYLIGKLLAKARGED